MRKRYPQRVPGRESNGPLQVRHFQILSPYPWGLRSTDLLRKPLPKGQSDILLLETFQLCTPRPHPAHNGKNMYALGLRFLAVKRLRGKCTEFPQGPGINSANHGVSRFCATLPPPSRERLHVKVDSLSFT